MKHTMTLKELKEFCRDQIREMKDAAKHYKNEEAGIDKKSGHYSQTSRYETKLAYENQIAAWETFYDLVRPIRRLK